MAPHVSRRRTVRDETALSGKGLHGGDRVTVTVRPGDCGLWFTHGRVRTEAIAANVTDTTRSTRLGEVNTIEHLMSAFAGLEITDAEVEVTAPELPGLDGSAVEYVQALNSTGFTELDAQEVWTPFKRVFFNSDNVCMAGARGRGRWRYEFDLKDRWPGVQISEWESLPEQYSEELASARTFALAEEIPMILQAGLGQGLDKDSALVLGIEGFKNEPRFADEPARHKMLDLIGDLYLSGIPIRFLDVVSQRSGHRTNVRFAAMLRAAADASAKYEEQ